MNKYVVRVTFYPVGDEARWTNSQTRVFGTYIAASPEDAITLAQNDPKNMIDTPVRWRAMLAR